MLSTIITIATLLYSTLETLVFGPARQAGQSLSVFNHVDFKRSKDKHNRAPQSIFTALRGKLITGKAWYDKAMYFAGFDGSENDWIYYLPGAWPVTGWWYLYTKTKGKKPAEVLSGYVDKRDKFNADSIFDLWCYFVYQHGGVKAKEIVFDKIINPMFNLGLKTVDNPSTSHRFTAPDRRFFWLYDDYLRLKFIANAPNNQYRTVFYTKNRTVAHDVDIKPYAVSLLNLLQNYPFTSGYFVDGLSDPSAIMAREVQILADIEKNRAGNTPPINDNPPPAPPTTKAAISGIGEKIFIGLFVGLIVTAIIKFFKKK